MIETVRKAVLVFAPNLQAANQFLRFYSEEIEGKTARSYADTLKNFDRYLLKYMTMVHNHLHC